MPHKHFDHKMPHGVFEPTAHNLLPFNPVSLFVAIAGFAIVVNLLVLLRVLAEHLKPNLAKDIKQFIFPATRAQEDGPCRPTQRPADGDYEMDVGVGSSTNTATLAKRTVLEGEVRDDAASIEHTWGPGGAAMRGFMG
jgi:hypothetical protein